jgi:hypothetical protein
VLHLRQKKNISDQQRVAFGIQDSVSTRHKNAGHKNTKIQNMLEFCESFARVEQDPGYE